MPWDLLEITMQAGKACRHKGYSGTESTKMIDITKEKVYLLSDCHKHHPEMPNYSSLHHYASAGCRAKDGTIIRLEIVRTPRICTSFEAYVRFVARLSEDPIEPDPVDPREKK